MWKPGWREALWTEIEQTAEYDLLIIGGGITGAGILREASRVGLKALLVEQGDFASGTSSRSSKLVHGGLRYLKTGQWRLTLESVRERQKLLRESGGLVTEQGFVTAMFADRKPNWWVIKLGMLIYDIMARQRRFKTLSPAALQWRVPRLRSHALRGAFWHPDAQTDDARLTLRVLAEALVAGGRALNYARASELLFADSQVCGVRVQNRETGASLNIRARLVINAAGAWCDRLRAQVGGEMRLRPLRGSHLVFDFADLPCAEAIAFFHPDDGRAVFIVPWEDRVLLGTTDLDHKTDLDMEPRCTEEEADYLIRAAVFLFPGLPLRVSQAVASYAGVRPVVSSGNGVKPSDESREHALWQEKGLLSITGGKLTTFRTTALEVLNAARQQLGEFPMQPTSTEILTPVDIPEGHKGLSPAMVRRLYGRYGQAADTLLAQAQTEQLKPIANTSYLWAELAWAAGNEAVEHLGDLLLRRCRLGFLLPDGGVSLLPEIRALCQPVLGWDDARWETEARDYRREWQRFYAPPGREAV